MGEGRHTRHPRRSERLPRAASSARRDQACAILSVEKEEIASLSAAGKEVRKELAAFRSDEETAEPWDSEFEATDAPEGNAGTEASGTKGGKGSGKESGKTQTQACRLGRRDAEDRYRRQERRNRRGRTRGGVGLLLRAGVEIRANEQVHGVRTPDGRFPFGDGLVRGSG